MHEGGIRGAAIAAPVRKHALDKLAQILKTPFHALCQWQQVTYTYVKLFSRLVSKCHREASRMDSLKFIQS